MEEYENTPIVVYSGDPNDCSPYFYRVCPKCGRFVRADDKIIMSPVSPVEDDRPNATCNKCGRVQMPFGGWYEEIEEGWQ